MKQQHLVPWILLLMFSFSLSLSVAVDAINGSQQIRDGQTLVSAGGVFVLGFFSDNSTKRYLGIWYKLPVQTIVWVANRENPLVDLSGVLKLSTDGNLALVNDMGRTVWSSGTTSGSNSVARLLDSGNLVIVTDGHERNPAWQSFDHPSDTLLPGMKLGLDSFRMNVPNLNLTSWRSEVDPSPGRHSLIIDVRSANAVLVSQTKDTKDYKPVNLIVNEAFLLNYVSTMSDAVLIFETKKRSVIPRLVVSPSGEVEQFVWAEEKAMWEKQDARRVSCGPNGFYFPNSSPECICVNGTQPKSSDDWSRGDFSKGCSRGTSSLDCGPGDGVKLRGADLPETSNAVETMSMNLEECRDACLRNCSCTAYANYANSSGIFCIMWAGDLLQLRQNTSGGGHDLYVRVAASYPGRSSRTDRRQKWLIGGLSAVAAAVVLLILLSFTWRRRKIRTMRTGTPIISYPHEAAKGEVLKLPSFDLFTIASATDNFSIANKIGQGGFGLVYKGILSQREVAVKRLLRSSGQGLEEFTSEIQLVEKLQHTNLVRLLGCCIEAEEKILIYEYMPNGSLDKYIFDPTRGALLDWPRRLHIIEGITQGLLYLHKYSRLKIIHRDLKASNILLDAEMNPKISDFGMARIFSLDRSQVNTHRIAGTYGYMAPEYAMDGVFSVKSDVFSYGVLLLEILSGKRNAGNHNFGQSLNLVGYAWELWTQGNVEELMDPSLGDSCPARDLSRCINVALLCVQANVADRPTMSAVSSMLSNVAAVLPTPNQPAFFFGKYLTMQAFQLDMPQPSANNITISTINGR